VTVDELFCQQPVFDYGLIIYIKISNSFHKSGYPVHSS